MKLYHGTAQEFTRFDMTFAVRQEAASNGYLGVWLTKTPEAAGAFGPVVLEVEANFNSTKIIKVEHLRRWHDESRQVIDARAYYDTIRRKLMEKHYDSIFIEEASHLNSQIYVALCPEKLNILGPIKITAPYVVETD